MLKFLALIVMIALIVIAFTIAMRINDGVQQRRFEKKNASWVPGTKPAAIPPKGKRWAYNVDLETWELEDD